MMFLFVVLSLTVLGVNIATSERFYQLTWVDLVIWIVGSILVWMSLNFRIWAEFRRIDRNRRIKARLKGNK